MNICLDYRSMKNYICVNKAHVYYQLSNNYRESLKKKFLNFTVEESLVSSVV